jgi:Rap1a immunity proteins
MRILLVLVGLMFLSLPIDAQTKYPQADPGTDVVVILWGNDLLDLCADDASALHTGLCDGYIIANFEEATKHSGFFCAPKHISNGDIIKAVKKRLAAFPAEFQSQSVDWKHFPANLAVAFALSEVYSCKEQR